MIIKIKKYISPQFFNKKKLINLYNTLLFLNIDLNNIDYYIFNNKLDNFKYININEINYIQKKDYKKYYIEKSYKTKVYSILDYENNHNDYIFKFEYSFKIERHKLLILFNYLIEYYFIYNLDFNIFNDKITKLFNKNISGYNLVKNNIINNIKNIKMLLLDIKSFKITMLTEKNINYILRNEYIMNYFKNKLKINFYKYYLYIYYNPLSSYYLKEKINLKDLNIMYLKLPLNYNNDEYLINFIQSYYKKGNPFLNQQENLLLFNYLYTSNIIYNKTDTLKIKLFKYLINKYFYKKKNYNLTFKEKIFIYILYKTRFLELENFIYLLSKQYYINLNKIIDKIQPHLKPKKVYLNIINKYDNIIIRHLKYIEIIKNSSIEYYIYNYFIPYNLFNKNNFLQNISNYPLIYKKFNQK